MRIKGQFQFQFYFIYVLKTMIVPKNVNISLATLFWCYLTLSTFNISKIKRLCMHIARWYAIHHSSYYHLSQIIGYWPCYLFNWMCLPILQNYIKRKKKKRGPRGDIFVSVWFMFTCCHKYYTFHQKELTLTFFHI